MYGNNKVKTNLAKPMPTGEPQLLCRGYNATNGCSRSECTYRRNCDILLASGETCNKKHSRQDHKEEHHGAITPA